MKDYRLAHGQEQEEQRKQMAAEFDRLFQQCTGYPAPNEALSLLYAKWTGVLPKGALALRLVV